MSYDYVNKCIFCVQNIYKLFAATMLLKSEISYKIVIVHANRGESEIVKYFEISSSRFCWL